MTASRPSGVALMATALFCFCALDHVTDALGPRHDPRDIGEPEDTSSNATTTEGCLSPQSFSLDLVSNVSACSSPTTGTGTGNITSNITTSSSNNVTQPPEFPSSTNTNTSSSTAITATSTKVAATTKTTFAITTTTAAAAATTTLPTTTIITTVETTNVAANTTVVTVSSTSTTTREDAYFDFRRRCPDDDVETVFWNRTFGGVIAVRLCPEGYTGRVYRMCYYGGTWGNVDYSECRVQQLIKLKHLLYYHMHKNLTEGLHGLTEELLSALMRYDLRSVDDYIESLDSLNIILNTRISLDFHNGHDIRYLKTVLTIADVLFSNKRNKWRFPQEQQELVTVKTVQVLHGLSHLAMVVADGLERSGRKMMVFHDFSHVGLEARVVKDGDEYRFVQPNTTNSVFLPPTHYNNPSTASRKEYAVVTTWSRGMASNLRDPDDAVNSDILSTVVYAGHDVHFLTGPVTVTLQTHQKPNGGQDDVDSLSECGYLRRTFNETSLWSSVGCEVIESGPAVVTCRCYHTSNVAVIVRNVPAKRSSLVDPASAAVMVGGAVCLCALLATFVAHANLIRVDSNGRGSSRILLNLIVSLAAAQLVFMLGIRATANHDVCEAISILLHYLYLVTCFWMLSHGIHLYQRVCHTDCDGDNCDGIVSNTRDYCLLSWVLPMVLVAVTFVLNPQGYETHKYCWLSIQKGMLLSFVVPISGLIMVNTTLMILVLKHHFETKAITRKSAIERTRVAVRAAVILLPFFGVNWFMGVLAVEDTSTHFFGYVFGITNALLGILIFVFFCVVNSEIRKLFNQLTSHVLKKHKPAELRLRRSRRSRLGLDSEPLLVNALVESPSMESTATAATHEGQEAVQADVVQVQSPCCYVTMEVRDEATI